MSRVTENLIDELCKVIDDNKYLLLTGGTAVGKTYIATRVAKACRHSKYNAQGNLDTESDEYDVEMTLIPIHSSFDYEDFVFGMSMDTNSEGVNFHYKDKIFMTILNNANASWDTKDNKKYILILDDIGRGMISGILGNILPLIEPHGNQRFSVCLLDDTKIEIPPNLYIIATRSTLIDNSESLNYAFLRHFYHRNIEADYKYMNEDATEIYSDYDISPNAMFCRIKRIILENLRYNNQLSPYDKEKYIVGHGVFGKNGIALTMKHQVLPMLKQYVKENILDRSAKIAIDNIEKMVSGKYTKDISLSSHGYITNQRTDVTSNIFYDEAVTHKPIVNLVSRIKTQGLMSDMDIADLILFNPGVLIRKSGKLNGVVRDYPTPAYLYVKKTERNTYKYGTTHKSDGTAKMPRYFYSANNDDMIKIGGVEYASASEMQPREYTRWSDDLNSDMYINERGSSSPNSIMFRILRSYYHCLINHYNNYLTEFPSDENILRLKSFACAEFEQFIEKVKLIGSGSDEGDVNLERNRMFREAVSKLVLLWTDMGQSIMWNGQNIKIEGVYKMDNNNQYKEYFDAMENLNIHQMILQGPPGTSKTYSAREYLKYIGAGMDNDNFLSDAELDSLQIKNYTEGSDMSIWAENHHGETQPIAWDIVQFHPSYGYEDFVRGIEVSTVQNPTGEGTNIKYDTVNKVLGKIAAIAERRGNENTKFFLVIDEINRANLATVFGELIYGLEYRERSVTTPYTVNDSNKVRLPKNLYILGTMNTADKSIGGIDYAIRRRFLFFPLLPNKETILTFNISEEKTDEENQTQAAINEKATKLFDSIANLFNVENINSDYYRDDVQIGHTYFLVDTEEKLFLRFKYQIIPILKEYYKDGIFQFEEQTTDDGFSGLISCISGEININSEEEKLKEIFEKLISEVGE